MRFKMYDKITVRKTKLRKNEKEALRELKKRITEKFPAAKIILYGSKARGDSCKESDIDLLILVESNLSTKIEEEIYHVSYEIELKYDVVFGVIIENKNFWDTPLANAMPLHWNIDREGVSI